MARLVSLPKKWSGRVEGVSKIEACTKANHSSRLCFYSMRNLMNADIEFSGKKKLQL